MNADESFLSLKAAVWAHIDAKRFDQAETDLRKLIDQIEPRDALRRWHYFGLLASVLNSLERTDDGTEMYRRALGEARLLPGPAAEVDVARYMIGEQYLLFGDPRDALEAVEPVPAGAGHDAAPNDERRAELSDQLRYILMTA